jgi:sulfite dehydrogenase (quinone) subunit SoeC
MISPTMVGDSFRLGYRFQRHWDVAMASAFFFGELGAGLFVVAMLYPSWPGLVLGLLVTGIGKPLFHLTHMGVPKKSWRAILRPDRSWTSRGLIGIVVFSGAGVLYAGGLATGGLVPLGEVWRVVAFVAALVVMTYQGFAMSHSTAIAIWSTALMPIASLLYALAGGAALMLVLEGFGLGLAPAALPALPAITLGLAGALLVLQASLLHAAHNGTPGAKLSARLLLRGRYAPAYLGLVLGAGIALPLAALGLAGDGLLARVVAAMGLLVGFYAFRVLIFKVGVFEPVMRFGGIGIPR